MDKLTVINLCPNPANAQATFAFELPQDKEEATLVIADLNGKMLNGIPLTSKQGQQWIYTRDLPAGMCITSAVSKMGVLKRGKLVINR